MKSFFAAAILAALPVSALAAGPIIDPYTPPFTEGKTLQPGEVWTTPYSVSAPDKFHLDVAFSGTGFSIEDLALVRFGINSATQSYTTYLTTGVTTGTGFVTDRFIDAPFSIVYELLPSASAAVSVTFTGDPEPITNVPEIGAEGAAVALLLVFGGLAVMTGARRRETV